MKVLFTNEAPLIRYGLAPGFVQANHMAKVIQGEAERLWGQPPEVQIQRLAWAIEEFRPDFLFTEGHPGFDPKSVCETAIRMGVPHVYWAIEDPVSTSHLSMQYAPHVDYIFTTTAECVPIYEALGKKAEVLLFGCNPDFHHFRGVHHRSGHDIVLVASNYSSRYDQAHWFVMPLVKSGWDIKIWGHWWDDPARPVNLLRCPRVYGGLLPYEEMPAVYSAAKVILGLNCDASSRTQTSMRPYEAMACGGGLYVSPYTKAQDLLFGDAIHQTRDADETLRTVAGILAMSEEERRARAAGAQCLVYKEHNYRVRAEQICGAVQSNF